MASKFHKSDRIFQQNQHITSESMFRPPPSTKSFIIKGLAKNAQAKEYCRKHGLLIDEDSCFVCGAKPTLYRWLQLGFCKKHKAECHEFTNKYKTLAQLEQEIRRLAKIKLDKSVNL